MKTLKTLAAIFILLAVITNLQAGDKIKIKLHQPPPNMLGVGDMWNLTLENTTKNDINIYLTGTATEEKDGLIIEGKSKVFTVKPGKTNYKYNDFSGAEVKYNNGKYKEIILRTGNAPEGSYTVCVTAFEESGEVAGMENCIMQIVQQLGSITLISPENGAELDPAMPLIFSWTPLPNAKDYKLRIVEIKGDESPETALQNNPEVFSVTSNTAAYTTRGGEHLPWPLKKKKYAWQVSSGDVVSEPYVIRIPMSSPGITLISPTNGKEIDPDSLSGLTFSWKECPKCPPMYTLRIVEIKGDQSPEEAFRSNQPILEKDYKSTTTNGDPVHGVDVKPGMKYAWQVSSGDVVSEIYSFKMNEEDSQKSDLKAIILKLDSIQNLKVEMNQITNDEGSEGLFKELWCHCQKGTYHCRGYESCEACCNCADEGERFVSINDFKNNIAVLKKINMMLKEIGYKLKDEFYKSK
jgi:hypothetical protein